MSTFKTPAISSVLRIIGSLALLWMVIVLAIVFSNVSEMRNTKDLLFGLPGIGIGIISFALAKIIDCLALIAHNTAPAAQVGSRPVETA
jgi:type II secretory pathway component PulF